MAAQQKRLIGELAKRIQDRLWDGQMYCGQIEANAMFFFIEVLAYNLSIVLKIELLPDELRNSTAATLRWQL